MMDNEYEKWRMFIQKNPILITPEDFKDAKIPEEFWEKLLEDELLNSLNKEEFEEELQEWGEYLESKKKKKEKLFDEFFVRQFFKFFTFKHPVEIRVFDEEKFPEGKSVFVNSENEFVERCRYYAEDKKVSVYIGGRDRIGKKEENVVFSDFIFIDIDDCPGEEERDKVLNFLQLNGFKGIMCGFSGNGWHFYIPLPVENFSDNETREKHKRMLKFFGNILEYNNIKIDERVFNLERVSRVLGTFNKKRGKISSIFLKAGGDIDESLRKANLRALKRVFEAFKDKVQVVEKKESVKKINIDDEPFIKKIKEKWNEGNRQDLTMSLAGYLRKEKRMGENSVKEIVREICESCDDSDINQRFSAVENTFKKDEKEIIGYIGLLEKGVDVNEGIPDIYDFLIIEYDKSGKEISRKVDIDAVSKYIEDKFNIRTIFGFREETLEVYNGGIWTAKGKGIVKAEIEKILGVYSKNHIVLEILEKIKRRTKIEREEADELPDFKRCVENGVLDLEDPKNIKLIPHSREFNFRTKFPVEYNPSAKCPNCLEFIENTFYPEDVLKIQEWLGFHLVRRYLFKKAVILHGPRDTGKTVFLNLLTVFVGRNTSGLSIQEYSRGKPFDLLVLKDKDANICDDMSSSDMKSVGGFKKAVGDGFIDAEQKFGDKIRFRNTAKDTNACNKIPNAGEDIDDEAYYGRIILIPVENVIPKDKQDKNLIDRLTTKEELSGLLNWAIEGYKRLIKQNGFSYEKSPEETKFLMIKGGNSLAEFASEVLEQANGEKILKDDLYKIYCDWCTNHKPVLSPDSKEKIGRSLNKFLPFVKPSSNGKIRYWLNIRINDTYDTFEKNMRKYWGSNKHKVIDTKHKVNDKLDINNVCEKNIYNFSKSVISVSPKTEVGSNEN